MALFSWFLNSGSCKKTEHKNNQLEQKVESFNANTMWPTAKVRRNPIVKQQEFTNTAQDKNRKEHPVLPVSLQNKEG